MAIDLSSRCGCPSCLEGSHSESDWNYSSRKRGDGASYSRLSKKSTLSPIMQRFLSQCCSNELESANKEDFTFLTSEEESSVDFSQTQNLSQTSKKTRPLKELTIQELLSKFGDSGKLPLHSVSLSHFRDHVVVKFRRALYYSGIWVKYVQGSGLKRHFSAHYFKRNPSSLHRLIPWLKRELTAICGDYGYTVKNILTAILHHMTKFNLDSESFTHLLEPYLFQHTQHFLHEFISFVYSSYNMETYDRNAIYQCPVSTWIKKKNIVSASVLPLPEDRSSMKFQHGIKQFKKNWNKTGQSSDSGFKQFPKGHSSKHSQISTTHQKPANKRHVWSKDEWGSDDFKDVVCTTNSLNWDYLRESRPDTGYYRNDKQETKSEGTKLLPRHVQDLKRHETSPHTFRTLVDSNQALPRKYNIRETNVFIPGKQVYHQKKEAEKKKLEESSLKSFQRLPRERTLIRSKSRESDRFCHCVSEKSTSPTRNDKMLASISKKTVRCSRSSRCVEVGSHYSRTTQRQYSPRTPRSKSWCVRSRKQSMSRGQSNLSLRENHRSKHCGLSKGNAHGCESTYRVASLNPDHCIQVCLTDGKFCKCMSAGEDQSQTGEHCDSLSCLQTEKYQSPRKHDMKGKHLVGRIRRIRTHRHKKPKYQCVATQTTAEISDDLEDLKDKSQQGIVILNV
ncbi:E3 ubiquitin-protein ligase Topors-like [Grammomys surdaster]|uniref:E3 ubiquitin-protein ligase Topors-like n=1 Tax=Grammomys surdaster TaxID=491861 RepID=UPI0010A06767|nr:E3 ubiquitin-protein ligase Topors-like [Grammomys surdaster]